MSDSGAQQCPFCETTILGGFVSVGYHLVHEHRKEMNAGPIFSSTNNFFWCPCGELFPRDREGFLAFAQHIDMQGGLTQHLLHHALTPPA